MKYRKMFGLAAVAAMALTALAASSASASALEVGGAGKNESVSITASLKSGTSAILSRTDGSLANTCTASSVAGDTEEPFIGTTVTGAVDTLSFTNCERTVTSHKNGVLHVEHIASTTNGTVSSSGAEVTVGSPFGTLNCKTGAGVDIGTLTGTDGTPAEHAELHINAVLNCGFLVPSAKWEGTYVVPSPTGLGVVQEGGEGGGTLGMKFTTVTYQKNQSGKSLTVDNTGTEDWKIVKDSFTSDSGSWSWSGGIQCSPQTVSPGGSCTRTDLACGNATGTVTWTVKVESIDGKRGYEEAKAIKCD